LTSIAAICVSSAAHAVVIWVDASSPSGGDGTSPSTAYQRLSDALIVASSGDTVLVAGGVHIPDSDSNPATPPTRAATFLIPEGVVVGGGYHGCTFGSPGGPDCDDALARDEESILDGNIGDAGLSSDNCLHVVMIANVAPAGQNGGLLTRLEGFTIRNGNSTPDVTDPPPPESFPCCCNTSNPEVFKPGGACDCVGSDPPASFGEIGVPGDGGAGVHLHNVSDRVFVVDCRIESCTGKFGGGMRCVCASPIVADCVFVSNYAQNGAGLCCFEASSPKVFNSFFISNDSTHIGGGAAMQQYGSAQFTNCVFYDNFAGDYGGGDNLFADPLFGLRLSEGSPCIDSGNTPDVPADAANLDGDASLTERVPLDAAPLNRFFRAKVDRGAYESEYCKADINGNGTVDGTDMAMLLGAWGTCNSPCPSDLTSSNVVDGADLTILFGAWGGCVTNAAMMAGPNEEGEASSAWVGPLTPQMLAEAFGFTDVTEVAQYLGSLEFETMQSLLEAYFGN